MLPRWTESHTVRQSNSLRAKGHDAQCSARIMITRSDVPIRLAQVFELCLDTKDARNLSSERTR